MLGLAYGEKLWRYVKPFSSDTGTLRTDGQTDGTDLLYQYRASVCWRAIKKYRMSRSGTPRSSPIRPMMLHFWTIFGLSSTLKYRSTRIYRTAVPYKFRRAADVKSCNPATCRFRDIRGQVARIGVSRGQKWCTGSPFLIPHLETPKDIATKRRGSPVRMTSCKIWVS